MTPVLITGGAGFFGGLLARFLLEQGQPVVSIDRVHDDFTHPLYTFHHGDIRDEATMDSLFARHKFQTIYHCAAILAHVTEERPILWSSNVDGTRITATCARKYGATSLVFISSNCLWAKNFHHPVTEDEPPQPVEIYGRSKWEGEKILESFRSDLNIAILRTPTIMDEGRLGLLTILFDFIREGRKVWVVGGGRNKYQFIYARDLAEACKRCASLEGFNLMNIGADHVENFATIYGEVIRRAGTKARVASLPKAPTLLAMKLAYHLGLSPLGPYQYKMIAEDFIFDTSRIKGLLNWAPTLRNEDMLWLAYQYYTRNFDEITKRTDVSAHKQAAPMGIIRLLKWIS